MEQNIQQTTENKLPTKTKITASVFIIVGLAIGCCGLLLFSDSSNSSGYLTGVGLILGIILAIIGLLEFFSGILILKRKEWAWFLGIAILILVIIFTLFLLPQLV